MPLFYHIISNQHFAVLHSVISTLACLSVTEGDVAITSAFEIRFQIRDQLWIPQPKLHGTSYLGFSVKSKKISSYSQYSIFEKNVFSEGVLVTVSVIELKIILLGQNYRTHITSV